jgi:hypothetical protein
MFAIAVKSVARTGMDAPTIFAASVKPAKWADARHANVCFARNVSRENIAVNADLLHPPKVPVPTKTAKISLE